MKMQLQNKNALQAIEHNLELAGKHNEAILAVVKEINGIKEDVLRVANQTEARYKETSQMVEDIARRVHIEDAEAHEIKVLVAQKATVFAKQYLDDKGIEIERNILMSKIGQFRMLVHKRLKRHFNVTKYTHIRHVDFEEALMYLNSININDFTPSEKDWTVKQREILGK